MTSSPKAANLVSRFIKAVVIFIAALGSFTQARAGWVTFPVTNHLGAADTNQLRVQMVDSSIRADGSVVVRGVPFRITPNGSATNLAAGYYLASNAVLVTTMNIPGAGGSPQGYLFYVPPGTVTNSFTRYKVQGLNTYNFYQGIHTIVGTNGFQSFTNETGVLVLNGENFTPTLTQVTNGLGFLPLTAAQTTNAIVLSTNGFTAIVRSNETVYIHTNLLPTLSTSNTVNITSNYLYTLVTTSTNGITALQGTNIAANQALLATNGYTSIVLSNVTVYVHTNLLVAITNRHLVTNDSRAFILTNSLNRFGPVTLTALTNTGYFTNNGDVEIGGSLNVDGISASGTISTTDIFEGNGSLLTNLNAGNLSAGTVPIARLSGIRTNSMDTDTHTQYTNRNGGNALTSTHVSQFVTNQWLADILAATNAIYLAGTNFTVLATNGYTTLVRTNPGTVVYTNMLPGMTNSFASVTLLNTSSNALRDYATSTTNIFTTLVLTNPGTVVYTNMLPGITNSFATTTALIAATNNYTTLVLTNPGTVVYTNMLPGVTNNFTTLVFTNPGTVLFTNQVVGITNRHVLTNEARAISFSHVQNSIADLTTARLTNSSFTKLTTVETLGTVGVLTNSVPTGNNFAVHGSAKIRGNLSGTNLLNENDLITQYTTNLVAVTNAATSFANGTFRWNSTLGVYSNNQTSATLNFQNPTWFISIGGSNLYSASSPESQSWAVVTGGSPVPGSAFGAYFMLDGNEFIGEVISTNILTKMTNVVQATETINRLSITNLFVVNATTNAGFYFTNLVTTLYSENTNELYVTGAGTVAVNGRFVWMANTPTGYRYTNSWGSLFRDTTGIHDNQDQNPFYLAEAANTNNAQTAYYFNPADVRGQWLRSHTLIGDYAGAAPAPTVAFATNLTLVTNSYLVHSGAPYLGIYHSSKVLFVDTNIAYAHDTGGSNGWTPFRTLTAAKNFATAGTKIVVRPGHYVTETNLLKNGVDWEFESPSAVGFVGNPWNQNEPIFTDLGIGAVTSKITGDVFRFQTWAYKDGHAIIVTNPASNLSFNFKETDATLYTYLESATTPIASIAAVTNCGNFKFHSDIIGSRIAPTTASGVNNAMTDVSYGQIDTFASVHCGFVWLNGPEHISFDTMTCNRGSFNQTIWSHATASATQTDFYVTGNLFDGTMYFDGAGTNGRVWITVTEVKNTSPGGLRPTFLPYGFEKIYITSQKLSSLDGIVFNFAGGGAHQVWLTVQKISSPSQWLLVNSSVLPGHWIVGMVNEWEDSKTNRTGVSRGIYCSDPLTQIDLMGNKMWSLQGPLVWVEVPGVSNLVLRNYTIDTLGGTNPGVYLNTNLHSRVSLKNVTLVTASTTNSISGVSGALFDSYNVAARTTTNANVTTRVNTGFTVDANIRQ